LWDALRTAVQWPRVLAITRIKEESMLFGNYPENRRKQFSAELKRELHKEQGGKCIYCGRKSELDLMDIDHKN
jgi:hypothetical protein